MLGGADNENLKEIRTSLFQCKKYTGDGGADKQVYVYGKTSGAYTKREAAMLKSFTSKSSLQD